MKRDVNVHPACQLLPDMTEEEFGELKADIEANGQRVPCVLFQDQLLDGQQRWRACEELGVEPQTCKLSDDVDPITFVLSANLRRRHLTSSQRAMIGVEVEKMLAAAAKQRQRAAGKQHGRGQRKLPAKLPEPMNGEAREQAAKHVGVSARSITTAKKIKKLDPQLADEVRKGKVTVNAARKMVAPTKADPSKRLEDSLLDLLGADKWMKSHDLATAFLPLVEKSQALHVATAETEGRWKMFHQCIKSLLKQDKIERRISGDDFEYRRRSELEPRTSTGERTDTLPPVPLAEKSNSKQAKTHLDRHIDDDDLVTELADQLFAAVETIQEAWPASRLDELAVILRSLAEKVVQNDTEVEPMRLKRQRRTPAGKNRVIAAT